VALELETTLEPHGPAAAIVLTDEQVATLDAGKTPPVRVTVNGASVGGRVMRRGGQNLIGFSKAARAELGVEPGQPIRVTIELDDQPREVEGGGEKPETRERRVRETLARVLA